MNTVLVLAGVRGSGKSTLLKKAQSRSQVKFLQPSTTRDPWPNDEDQYHHITKDEWKRADFAWTIKVQNHLYGLRKSQLQDLRYGEIGLTVFHPGNLYVLEKHRLESDVEFITVGLDTVASYEEMRERIGNDRTRDEGEANFKTQLQIVRACDVTLSRNAETVFDAFACIVRVLLSRGVLDKHAIRCLIESGTLLKHTSLANVQPASYDLMVGNAVWSKGKEKKLDVREAFEIPPYSYVIIKAEEEAHLPKFIVAHYDLKVSLFVQGIILSNGPQVDPGFHGGLLCMLFNGSDDPV